MDRGLWHCTIGSDQNHFQKKKKKRKEIQKGKMVVWGGHTNNCERIKVKGKGEKKRCTLLNSEFQRRTER